MRTHQFEPAKAHFPLPFPKYFANRQGQLSAGNSNLLQQLFPTDDEALTVGGNAYPVIPQNLVIKKATEKTRIEIVQDLHSNDSRNETNKSEEEVKTKRGQVSRCRTSTKYKITVNGPYVPYEQNFVTETMLYLCPLKQDIDNLPQCKHQTESELTVHL